MSPVHGTRHMAVAVVVLLALLHLEGACSAHSSPRWRLRAVHVLREHVRGSGVTYLSEAERTGKGSADGKGNLQVDMQKVNKATAATTNAIAKVTLGEAPKEVEPRAVAKKVKAAPPVKDEPDPADDGNFALPDDAAALLGGGDAAVDKALGDIAEDPDVPRTMDELAKLLRPLDLATVNCTDLPVPDCEEKKMNASQSHLEKMQLQLKNLKALPGVINDQKGKLLEQTKAYFLALKKEQQVKRDEMEAEVQALLSKVKKKQDGMSDLDDKIQKMQDKVLDTELDLRVHKAGGAEGDKTTSFEQQLRDEEDKRVHKLAVEEEHVRDPEADEDGGNELSPAAAEAKAKLKIDEDKLVEANRKMEEMAVIKAQLPILQHKVHNSRNTFHEEMTRFLSSKHRSFTAKKNELSRVAAAEAATIDAKINAVLREIATHKKEAAVSALNAAKIAPAAAAAGDPEAIAFMKAMPAGLLDQLQTNSDEAAKTAEALLKKEETEKANAKTGEDEADKDAADKDKDGDKDKDKDGKDKGAAGTANEEAGLFGEPEGDTEAAKEAKDPAKVAAAVKEREETKKQAVERAEFVADQQKATAGKEEGVKEAGKLTNVEEDAIIAGDSPSKDTAEAKAKEAVDQANGNTEKQAVEKSIQDTLDNPPAATKQDENNDKGGDNPPAATKQAEDEDKGGDEKGKEGGEEKQLAGVGKAASAMTENASPQDKPAIIAGNSEQPSTVVESFASSSSKQASAGGLATLNDVTRNTVPAPADTVQAPLRSSAMIPLVGAGGNLSILEDPQ